MTRRREIDQEELFEAIQRHPEWDAHRLCDELGYTSPATVRRYIKRYINRGELREVIEVVRGPSRPLNAPFLVGVVTDQQVYREARADDFPPDATYTSQEELTAYLLDHLGSDDLVVHDAMLVLGAPFDILLCVSARSGVSDIAAMVTRRLRRYRGVQATSTMPVAAWHHR